MPAPDELDRINELMSRFPDKTAPTKSVHTLPHFTRTELQEIGTRAHELAGVEGLNHEWRQVYEQLALAASTLDAFLARAELPLVIAKYAPAGDETGRPKDPQQTTIWDWDSPSEAH